MSTGVGLPLKQRKEPGSRCLRQFPRLSGAPPTHIDVRLRTQGPMTQWHRCQHRPDIFKLPRRMSRWKIYTSLLRDLSNMGPGPGHRRFAVGFVVVRIIVNRFFLPRNAHNLLLLPCGDNRSLHGLERSGFAFSNLIFPHRPLSSPFAYACIK
jgi:hypothetical protein